MVHNTIYTRARGSPLLLHAVSVVRAERTVALERGFDGRVPFAPQKPVHGVFDLWNVLQLARLVVRRTATTKDEKNTPATRHASAASAKRTNVAPTLRRKASNTGT